MFNVCYFKTCYCTTVVLSQGMTSGVLGSFGVRLRLKCDGTRAGTRIRLSAKRTGPFKSAGASVQSTTGSRGVRISGSNAGYTMFRRSVKGTGYPLQSRFSLHFPSRGSPCDITFQLDSSSYRGFPNSPFSGIASRSDCRKVPPCCL
jgi:hypothetical protein